MRTPLIAKPGRRQSEMYKRVNKIIPPPDPSGKKLETFGARPPSWTICRVNLTERGLLIEELLVKKGIMDEGESLYSG